MIVRSRPPILLIDGRYYGTLAAVRCLGRAGVPVTAGDPHRLALARLSRYATRSVWCPGMDNPERLVEWLLDFGRREPGHVLYATSDNVAWLYARHAAELSAVYHMYQPTMDCIRRLLDKRELARVCGRVGIETPPSFFPLSGTESELAGLAVCDELMRNYPLLIKPAAQVLVTGYSKGCTIDEPDELVPAYRAFAAHNRYQPSVLAEMPGIGLPMLQAYLSEAVEGIYSVAGFVNRSGSMTALASRKVLQRPRKLGIGLCFEEEPLNDDIARDLAALCRHVGYFGVFESEFIVSNGRHLLIDFNPRFYSQMAFEIDRGLPLPLMVYEAALGDDDFTARVPVPTTSHLARGPRAYSHHFVLNLLLVAQWLAGRMTRAEVRHWLDWRRSHRDGLTDAVIDHSDPGPLIGEIATRVKGYVSHPAVTVRSMVFNR